MEKKNPFTIKPIKEKEKFIGRKNLINQVTDMLSTQQSCHMIGERKSGKTSFLYRMAEKFKEEEDIEFVYLDMMQFGSYEPEEFLGRIARHIDKDLSKKKMKYKEFEDFIKNRKVILAFDEISSVVENKNLDIRFFNFLRAIASNFEVVYLTTHREGLEEIPGENISSPFFNIFRNFDLKYFTKEESEELIQEGGKRFLSNYGEWILERAYYHPFLLQFICLVLFEYYKDNKEDRESIFSKTEEEAYRTLEGHFKFWHDKSSDEEKRLLTKIARKENISAEEKSVVSNLERRLLVYRKNDKYDLVSPFFEKIIKLKEEKEEKEHRIEIAKKEEKEEKEHRIEIAKKEEKEELEKTPLSQYCWIILLFLIYGLILSYRMKDLLFLVFYIGSIVVVLITLIYRGVRRRSNGT